MDQQHCIDTIENLDIAPERSSPQLDNLTTVEHTSLRTLAGRLNWSVQGSRPDLSFEMVELSTKFKFGVVNDLLRAIKAIKKLQHEAFKIFFPSLGDYKFCKIIMFLDASHANFNDSCCELAWKINKLKRVVQSTIAAEALN